MRSKRTLRPEARVIAERFQSCQQCFPQRVPWVVSAGEIPSRFKGVLPQWLGEFSMLLTRYQGRSAFWVWLNFLQRGGQSQEK